MTGSVPVTFEPSGTTVWVEPNALLLDVFHAAGEPVIASCGGNGRCGTCGVRVLAGDLTPPDPIEEELIAGAKSGTRLACRARVIGPVTVRALVSLGATSSQRTMTSSEDLAAGVDLGTTNVSAVVFERRSGLEVGRATVPNLQSSFGADVLSRLAAAEDGSAGELAELAQRSVVESLQLAAGPLLPHVSRVAIAANTAMVALISGADVSSLAHTPFALPELPDRPSLERMRNGLSDAVEISLLEPLAAFVGGDIAAGIDALDLRDRSPSLLVDMGTNAEVALSVGGRISVASAPAGPAFEAAGVSCGGPAAPGGVFRVARDVDEIVLDVLPGAGPRWLTGSGLISAVAMLSSAGHIGVDGLFHAPGPLSGRFFTRGDGVRAVRLSDDLELTQLDVRALQLAKAAVRVAIEVVLRQAATPARSLVDLFVAGAFGGAIDPRDLVALGIVPASASGQVKPVGNTALAGAVKAAARDEWPLVGSLSMASVHHVDLPGSAEFGVRLMSALELSPYDI